MEMSFRWYGNEDPITLDQIKQIPGMVGIVSAIYDVPVGEVWPYKKILDLKQTVEKSGLTFNVIESVPVHEEIKMGLPTRDRWIENYIATLRNLAKAGIKTVCYNFMPVFDWTRSQLDAPLADGSHSLLYDEQMVKGIDPFSGALELPGWDLSYQKDDLRRVVDQYQTITEEKLMENLIYFLQKIVPVAEEEDIMLAIHPDDPPWSVFGLPRVITNKENIDYMLRTVNSPNNGLTFCTGSFGADPANDLIEIIETARESIHFVHARNVKWKGDLSFQETSHLSRDGSLDMAGIISKLHEIGYKGPIRPDHGRMIWEEEGKPGYGLYDRALGATYLNGLIDAVNISSPHY